MHARLGTLIKIDFYDPMTRRMVSSKLPPMKRREFAIGEEFDAYVREICGDSSPR